MMDDILNILMWPVLIGFFVVVVCFITCDGYVGQMNYMIYQQQIVADQKFQNDTWLMAHDEELMYELQRDKTFDPVDNIYVLSGILSIKSDGPGVALFWNSKKGWYYTNTRKEPK